MIRIRKALESDRPAIVQLLEESGLPDEGLDAVLPRMLVGEVEGLIVATAGLAKGDGCALLRSVAVDRSFRGQGLGVEIVRQTLRLASVLGVQTVYLLTESAGEFFPRFGFKPALRAEVEAHFPDSSQTAPGGACKSAMPMVLRDLGGPS